MAHTNARFLYSPIFKEQCQVWHSTNTQMRNNNHKRRMRRMNATQIGRLGLLIDRRKKKQNVRNIGELTSEH